MTRDDIIRMAREAGFADSSFCRWSAYTDDLERFASLVAAAEREGVERSELVRQTDTCKRRKMNWEEYNRLFHKHQLNLVAFKRLMDCDEEVLKLVNAAIEAEREACARVAESLWQQYQDTKDAHERMSPQPCIADAIRARGD